jgi:tetratricopeptide (TPR) repeat protein
LTILFNNRKLFCLFAFFLLVGKDALSQISSDPKENFLDGEYYISQGMYKDALPSYLAILKKEPDNSNVNYRVGLCYMKLGSEESKALPYLQKAVENIDVKYVEGKFKSTGAPPEAWILLGDAYLRQNLLDDASGAYTKYRDLIGTDTKKLAVINKRIDGIAESRQLQQTSQNLQILNIGNAINSKYSDNHPVLTADQNTIVYTQNKEDFEKIMINHKLAGEWGQPVEITRQLGSEGDCYTTWISNDGSELLLIKHDEVNTDIYSSKLVKGKWQKMQPIAGKINTKYNESSACISPDGNSLYFSSDKPKGLGGYDIYVADKTGDSWGNVRNLGKLINTDKDEINPYISSDGNVLYFSSNGHKSVGNMDILYSEKDAGGNWQDPVNPGKPINTTNDELSYIYFADTKTGYISKDLPQGVGKEDIYTVTPAIEEPALAEITVPPVIESPVNNVIPNADTVIATQPLTPTEPVSTVANPDVKNDIVVTTATVQTSRKKKTKEIVKPLTINPGLTDTTSIYTIQILALLHPKESQKFKVSDVIVSEGDDGFSRYTHGEFKDLAKAQASLKNLKNKGFRDAFIRKINTIPNYSKMK